MGLLENKRTIVKNKRAVLGIKGHFLEVEGHIVLRTRVLTTSLPLWSGHLWMFQAKIEFQKFFNGQFFQWARYPNP